jgi:hypothetical protein
MKVVVLELGSEKWADFEQMAVAGIAAGVEKKVPVK